VSEQEQIAGRLWQWILGILGFIAGCEVHVQRAVAGLPVTPILLASVGFLAGRGIDRKQDRLLKRLLNFLPLVILLVVLGLSVAGKDWLTRAAFDRGEAALRRGDGEGAIEHFTEAIRLHPQYAKAYANRGLAYMVTGDFARALPDLNEAIRLQPRLALAYVNRSAWYVEQDRYEEGIADCTEAIRLDPRLVLAYVNRSFAYNETERPDLAIADCNVALGLEPNCAEAYLNRGRAYDAKVDFPQSRADFQRAFELKPELRPPPPREEMQLIFDRGRLARYGIDMKEAIQAVRTAGFPFVEVDGDSGAIPFRVSRSKKGRQPDPDTIKDVVVKTVNGIAVRMRDVGYVRIVRRELP